MFILHLIKMLIDSKQHDRSQFNDFKSVLTIWIELNGKKRIQFITIYTSNFLLWKRKHIFFYFFEIIFMQFPFAQFKNYWISINLISFINFILQLCLRWTYNNEKRNICKTYKGKPLEPLGGNLKPLGS